MGDDAELPDLGMTWRDGDNATATFTFTRLDLHMLARAGLGDYTSSRSIAMEREYLVTFELDQARFDQLLGLLPAPDAAGLRERLGGPFRSPTVVEIPPGAMVVGLRARLGAVRAAGLGPDAERYVPLVVESVFAPSATLSIEVEPA